MSARERSELKKFRNDLLAEIAAIFGERQVPHVRAGIILAGSWDAETGTVEVQLGDTYADQFPGQPNGSASPARLPVLTTQFGDQYAPVGGEDCLCFPLHEDQYAVLIFHKGGTSQTVPSGERWIVHKGASGSPTASVKLTNDGQTAHDGLGAVRIVGGGYASVLAPLIEFGMAMADMTDDAVIRARDLYPLITALNNLVSALDSHRHTGVQGGSGVSGAPVSSFSTFNNPTGSTITKAKD
jgi:hypothetical protein